MVWHHSLLLMNSFNKTETAVFSCRLCYLGAFPFISLILNKIHTFVTEAHKIICTSMLYASMRYVSSNMGPCSVDCIPHDNESTLTITKYNSYESGCKQSSTVMDLNRLEFDR